MYTPIILDGVWLTHPVPLETILLPIGSLLILHSHAGEEYIPVLLARRDEFAQEEEEGGQADGLDELEPGVEVDLGRGEANRQKRDDGPEGDDEGDSEDSSFCS